MAACASGSRPGYDYSPPPGSAPTEIRIIDTSDLEGRSGFQGDKIGAEVVGSEVSGDQQSYEILVPLPPDQVDDVEIVSPGGGSMPETITSPTSPSARATPTRSPS